MYSTKVELIISAAFGFLMGMFVYHFLAIRFWPNRHKLYTWVYGLRNHSRLGEPFKTDLELDRTGYSLGYSFEHRCALWVSYIITKGSVKIDVERELSFMPDPDIPEKYRVMPSDFTNSGYDKGHLAPSADIDYSQRSNQETFFMSNVALQDPKLNRQAWSSLEGLSREWTKKMGKLYIVTGPIYGQRSKRVNEIPVPRAFYKVFYAKKHGKAIGFILPNKAITASELWQYAMSVADVEKETGGNFYSKLGRKGAKMKRQLDLDWWQK